MTLIIIYIKFILIGIIITSIGALPFGLVNLSVAHTAYHDGLLKARKIAIGASFVEVIFSLLALIISKGILSIDQNNPVWNYSITAILSIVAISFFFKKNNNQKKSGSSYHFGILKGIILNIISLQVFLFWLLAMMFIATTRYKPLSNLEILLFIIGVVIGKLLILEIYGHVGIKIFQKSTFIEKNINRIIGFLIFSAALFQFTKF